jgi:hypothetical protein
MRIKILLLSISIFCSQCHYDRIKLDSAPATGQVVIVETKRVWYWSLSNRAAFWKPEAIKEIIDLTTICPSGASEIEHFYNWKQATLSQVTFGIYIPYSLKITCK